MEQTLLDMINEIGKNCRTEKLTLSVAESVTSGYLQYLFSQGEQCSSYYQGGISLYNNYQKKKHFGISPALTSSNNGVSPLVSELLAKETNSLFETNIGIGITGFAHRDPEFNVIEPHCYIAIALDDQIIYTAEVETNSDSMEQNQIYFASQCIAGLHKIFKTIKLTV